MVQGGDRELRDLIQARYQIIKVYTNLMNYIRGLLRQEGIRINSRGLKESDCFLKMIGGKLPDHIKKIIGTYKDTIQNLIKEKDELEDKIKTYKSKEIDLLKSIPGIGEISSRTIQSAIGEIKRFKKAKQLTSYCGLVPTVRASGERVEYGHITREGRSEVRRVGIQCAHAVLRSKSLESLPLKRWCLRVAKRRGLKTAIVALARKLITIIFYVLRDKREYDYTLLMA
jgi:transposase